MKAGRPNTIKRLGEMLKKAIRSGDLTAKDLVKRSGIPRSYVYQVIKGDLPGMTLSTFEKICEAAGIDPGEVYGAAKKAPQSVLKAHGIVAEYLKGK